EKLAVCPDGTANTLMVGECTFNDVTRRATFWAYTYASYNQSSLSPDSHTINNRYGNGAAGSGCYEAGLTLSDDQMCKRAFGSNHAKGMNFAMGDGSVRFISNNVDIQLLCNMATMMGNEPSTIP